jgi:hypothetical protein
VLVLAHVRKQLAAVRVAPSTNPSWTPLFLTAGGRAIDPALREPCVNPMEILSSRDALNYPHTSLYRENWTQRVVHVLNGS